MVKWLDRDRKGDPFTREHFNHLFFTNIIIAVSEIIKEIDRHEHILIDEDADRKIFCDCKLN